MANIVSSKLPPIYLVEHDQHLLLEQNHFPSAYAAKKPVIQEKHSDQLGDAYHVTWERSAPLKSEQKWISIFILRTLPLTRREVAAFDLFFRNRVWRHLSSTANSITFCKGNQKLTFSAERRLIVNLIGIPGCGKGTQGEILAKLYPIPAISAGDIYRDEYRNETKLGKMIQTFAAENAENPILPDEILVGMMAKRLSLADCKAGFILDGFPRTAGQAEIVRETFLRPRDTQLPFWIDTPMKDVWARCSNRLICPSCGHQARALQEKDLPKFCPSDNTTLERRKEDATTEKTKFRIEKFLLNKDGILNNIRARDPILQIGADNTVSPEEVAHQICSRVQKRFDHLAKAEFASRISFATNVVFGSLLFLTAGILLKKHW